MHVSRFRGEGEGLTDLAPLVLARRSTPNAGAFWVCPLVCRTPGVASAGMVHEIYRLAYEQAVAVSRPPRHERLFLASSN